MMIPQNLLKNIKCIYDGNNIDNIIYDNNSLSPISHQDSFLISPFPQLLLHKEIKSNLSLDNNINNNERKSIIPKFSTKIYKEKIFNINKINKLGRIKKNSNKKGKHNKFKKDNIIRLFKVRLMKSMYDYINDSFKINKNPNNKKIKILQKLSSKFIKCISKKDNLKWLNTKLSILFSQNISTKNVRYDSDYNKNIIRSVYDKGKETDVINILNKTVKEMWIAYINNDKTNYIGLSTLNDDIEKFKKKGETDEYINKYEDVAREFEVIFRNINQREKIKK